MNAQQIADAIRALESLRQEGLLSEDEFAREKDGPQWSAVTGYIWM